MSEEKTVMDVHCRVEINEDLHAWLVQHFRWELDSWQEENNWEQVKHYQQVFKAVCERRYHEVADDVIRGILYKVGFIRSGVGNYINWQD